MGQTPLHHLVWQPATLVETTQLDDDILTTTITLHLHVPDLFGRRTQVAGPLARIGQAGARTTALEIGSSHAAPPFSNPLSGTEWDRMSAAFSCQGSVRTSRPSLYALSTKGCSVLKCITIRATALGTILLQALACTLKIHGRGPQALRPSTQWPPTCPWRHPLAPLPWRSARCRTGSDSNDTPFRCSPGCIHVLPLNTPGEWSSTPLGCWGKYQIREVETMWVYQSPFSLLGLRLF